MRAYIVNHSLQRASRALGLLVIWLISCTPVAPALTGVGISPIAIPETINIFDPDLNSDNSKLAFVGQIDDLTWNVYVLDLTTNVITTELPIRAFYPISDAKWSPDNSKISFAGFNRLQPNVGIWILGGTPNIVPASTAVGSATWSPDGSRLAVVGYIDGKYEIRITDLATKKSEPIYTLISANSQDTIGAVDWSPDGSTLTFIQTEKRGDGDVQHLSRIDVNGRNLQVFRQIPNNQAIHYHKWVLQGKWIALLMYDGSINKLSFLRSDDQCIVSPLRNLDNTNIVGMDISKDGTIAVIRVGVNLYKLDIDTMLAPRSLEGTLICP